MSAIAAVRITGRFEILSLLGAGGMGVVYSALDHERGEHVALKTLAQSEPASLQHLKQEFRSLADIVHPNLVALYELVSSADGVTFFTMELVSGVDFLRYVRDGARAGDARVIGSDAAPTSHDETAREEEARRSDGVDLDRLREALRQLASGLIALHSAGKLHCDIKPSNVLIRGDGRVVILDFGLARDSRRNGVDDDFEGALIGTPLYLSPEQVAGEPPTPASDWYGVGVMLYQALTGERPFTGSARELLQRKQLERPPSPAELVPGLPADLVQLCVQLLAPRPADRPAEAAVRLALGVEPAPAWSWHLPLDVPAFVGRLEEQDALLEAVAATRRGQPVLALVHGRSGMGKSSLTERLFESLGDRRGVLVLRGRCHERESVPYQGLDGLIDALRRHLRSLPLADAEALIPPDVHALARLFPNLNRLPAISAAAATVALDDQEIRWRGVAALKRLLASLGARSTLILHIDDLQWADVDTATLLIELLRPPSAPGMLLIAAYRSEDVEGSTCLRALLEEARSTGFRAEVRRIELAPLTPAESFELALTLLVQQPLTARSLDEVAASIARESSGSPLFVCELVYAARRGNHGEMSLSHLLEERIRGLPEDARRLLEMVAIAGSPVEQAIAAEAAGVAQPRALLSLLRWQRLVRARGLADHDPVETYHDRIRETVIASLAPKRRSALHRRLAESLEARGAGDAERLAEHWRLAGDFVRAGEMAEMAGDRAVRALAFDRAARLYALALDRSSIDGASRRDLEIRRGDALVNAGRGAEAAQAYQAAAKHASLELALELDRRAGEQLLSSGHIDEGLAVLKDVLSRLGMWLPATPRQALVSLLVRRAELRLRGLRYRDSSPSSISTEDRLRIDTCWALTVGLNGVDMVRGADFGARSLLLALRAGDTYRIGRALAFETTSAAFVGGTNRARAERLANDLMALAARVDSAHLHGFALLVRGMCDAFAAGQWAQALGWYARAEEVFRAQCRGVPWEVATTDLVTSWSLFYMGRIKVLAARLPASLKAAEQRRDLYAQANLVTSTAWVMLAADDVTAAREHPVEVMARWSRNAFHLQHYVALIAETHIDRYAGRGADAWTRLEQSSAALAASLLLRVQSNRIVASYERGCTALAAAETSTARTALMRVAEKEARALAAEKMAWAEPFVDLIRAGIAALEADRTRALVLLERAEHGFSRADMHLYAASARRRRGEALRGDGGRALVVSADARMLEEEIEDPARWAAMLAPGFGRA